MYAGEDAEAGEDVFDFEAVVEELVCADGDDAHGDGSEPQKSL